MQLKIGLDYLWMLDWQPSKNHENGSLKVINYSSHSSNATSSIQFPTHELKITDSSIVYWIQAW